MAEGDTVYNEERVRGRIIPLDVETLGSKQRPRQEVDRRELASSIHDAMVELEVDQWVLTNGLTIDEDTERIQLLQEKMRRRRQGRR